MSTSIVLIPLLALVAPLVARLLAPVVAIPVVVFEIVLGIVAGPSVLNLVKPTEFTSTLAEFGLAMLFFIAGSEINFASIWGRPLARSSLGWLISLCAGLLLALLITSSVPTAVVVGIAVCSTALGTLLPILRDAGELTGRFGIAVTANGAVGEFGPIVAISLFLSGRSFDVSAVVLLAFVAIAGLAIVLAARRPHGRLHIRIAETLHTSSQIAVRTVVLILGALVALSLIFGLDMLLGAFAAGVLWQAIMRGAPEQNREGVETKIEGLAFGFLVPVFFINTGVTFDLKALISNPGLLVLVPVFLLMFLVVRGLPSLLAAPVKSASADKRAIVLLGATGLPIIVAVTAIGEEAGLLSTGISAALVGAGMLSVLLFPILALSQHRRASRTPDAPALGNDGEPAATTE